MSCRQTGRCRARARRANRLFNVIRPTRRANSHSVLIIGTDEYYQGNILEASDRYKQRMAIEEIDGEVGALSKLKNLLESCTCMDTNTTNSQGTKPVIKFFDRIGMANLHFLKHKAI